MGKIKQTSQTWLAALAALGLSAILAQAQTTVSGYVSGTWTQTGSPYVVVGDVLVTSLVIQSNVQVQFDGPYVFEVQGILQASGTATNPIVFNNTAANANKGWNGIFFNESGPEFVLELLPNLRLDKQWSQDTEQHPSDPKLRNRRQF